MPTSEIDSPLFVPPEDAVDISPKQDRGVLKQIITEGSPAEGKPSTGDTVYVHYVGTLTNGTKFDSSRDRGDKFSFNLGTGNVIKAWDIGVATMNKGEVCKLICASDYAYGESGSGSIPPNATLIFEVELFSWTGEDLSKAKDGGIVRSVLTPGEGYINPNSGSQVQVSLVGSYEGRVFDERDIDFELDEGSDHDIVSGVETALKKFKAGEQSVLKLASKYAFGAEGHTGFKIPPNADVEYKVTLKKFEKAKESWEMNFDEKYEKSAAAKEKGTEYFKAGEHRKAAASYQKVVELLAQEQGLGEEEQKKQQALVLVAHLNLAMCQLKLNKAKEARENCESALKMDSRNVKGLFRRGQSYMSTRDWHLALADFKAVLDIEPSNTAAKNQLALAMKKIKDEKQKEKSTYAGMFDKFAAKDAMGEQPMGYQGEINVWSNSMADGMMALPEELAMFGEQMPGSTRDQPEGAPKE